MLIAAPRSVIGRIADIACQAKGSDRSDDPPAMSTPFQDDPKFLGKLITDLRMLHESYSYPPWGSSGIVNERAAEQWRNTRKKRVAERDEKVKRCLAWDQGGSRCRNYIEEWGTVCRLSTMVDIASSGERAVAIFFDANSPEHGKLLQQWVSRCSPRMWLEYEAGVKGAKSRRSADGPLRLSPDQGR
jgi:hypothetical protein